MNKALQTRRGFSLAAIVLILAALHLMIVRGVVATSDDAIATADAIEAARAEAALASGLNIAAGELLAGRDVPEGTVTLTDNTTIEITVSESARPWTVTVRAESGRSQRARTFIVG